VRGTIIGLLFLCLGIAGVAAANPVALTSGTIFLPPFGNSGSFALAGPGFSATGSGTFPTFLITFNAGQTLDLSQSISITPGSFDQGVITTGGVTYDGFARGDFQITAKPFVVGDVSGTQTLSTTATLSGLVQLFAHPTGSAPLLIEAVTGAGTIAVTAQDQGGGHFVVRNDVLVTLGPAPVSPTPEPGSLLLFAIGLGAVWQTRRLRRAK
jgi:hypothetical protein